MQSPQKNVLFLLMAFIGLFTFHSAAQPIDTSAWLYNPITGIMQRVTRSGVLADSFALPIPDTSFDGLPTNVIASPNGLTLAYVVRSTTSGQQELVLADVNMRSIVLRYAFGTAPYNSIDVGGKFAFSPDGGAIAFGYALDPEGWELVVINLGGGGGIAALLTSGTPDTASIASGFGIIPTPTFFAGTSGDITTYKIGVAFVQGGAGGALQYDNYVWTVNTNTLIPSIGYGSLFGSDFYRASGEIIMPLIYDGLPTNDDLYPFFGHVNTAQAFIIERGARFPFYYSADASLLFTRFAAGGRFVIVSAQPPGDMATPILRLLTRDGFAYPLVGAVNPNDVLDDTLDGYFMLDYSLDRTTASLLHADINLADPSASPAPSVIWTGTPGQSVNLVWAGQIGTNPALAPAPSVPEWTTVGDVMSEIDALLSGGGSPAPTLSAPAVLTVGGIATVRTTAGDSLNVRSGAGTSFAIIEKLQSGVSVTLLEGPVSANNFTWWRVRTPSGREGWVVESADGVQTLVAGAVASGVGELDEALEGIPSSGLASMLRVGDTALVTLRNRRDALRLRNSAGLGGRIIVLMPSGTRLTVVGGPQLVDGFTWWQVRTPEGNLGWTAEIVGDERVLTPTP